MRVKEATTNDRSLTSASQRRGRFITGRSSLCLHLVRPSSDRPLAPNTWAAEILDGEMQPRRDLGGVRHRSVDTLRGYVRDAELFKDHAFGHPATRRWGAAAKKALLFACYLLRLLRRIAPEGGCGLPLRHWRP
jgi:hypothetical protein